MSALAALGGLLIWFVVLSLPLAIYFVFILVRRGREVREAHWAKLRPVGENREINDPTLTMEERLEERAERREAEIKKQTG